MTEQPQREMPVYICHKRVWALKIKSVDEDAGQLHFEEDGYAPRRVHDGWIDKHMPAPGGYFVVYADGYESYSPAKAFEEGYALDRTSTCSTTLLNTIKQA